MDIEYFTLNGYRLPVYYDDDNNRIDILPMKMYRNTLSVIGTLGETVRMKIMPWIEKSEYVALCYIKDDGFVGYPIPPDFIYEKSEIHNKMNSEKYAIRQLEELFGIDGTSAMIARVDISMNLN